MLYEIYEEVQKYREANKKLKAHLHDIRRQAASYLMSMTGGSCYVWYFSMLQDGPQFHAALAGNASRPGNMPSYFRFVVPWNMTDMHVRDMNWNNVIRGENYSWSGSVKRFTLGVSCPME